MASIAVNALKDCPIKKTAKNELQIAIYIGSNVCNEINPREGVNRMLTHLESAFIAYIGTMGTWDIWDYKKVIWNQAKIQNEICIYIALAHYVLGNQKNVSKWLIYNMSTEGPWEICANKNIDLRDLGFQNKSVFDLDFYKKVLGEDYESFYQKVVIPSNQREHEIEIIDDDMDDYLYMEAHRL